MKLSLLQQIPRPGYGSTGRLDPDVLRKQSDLTLEDTFEMIDEAGRRGISGSSRRSH